MLALEIGRHALESLGEQLEQLLLAVGDRRNAFEAGEEIGRDGFVAVNVHREIHTRLVHRIANAEHFGTPLRRGRMPFAVEVGSGRVGPKVTATGSVRVHVRHDMERTCLAQDARHRIVFIGELVERAFHPPFGHRFAGVLTGIKPHR